MLSTVFLYEEPSSTTLDIGEIKNYLEAQLKRVEIVVRSEFISYHTNSKNIDTLATALAKCKVRSLDKRDIDFEPLSGEIEFEKGLLSQPARKITGVLYDGLKLMSRLRELLPKSERNLRQAHVVFTNRLFGTFDENDLRYHARVIICGYPSLISTTGVVEAPAKPKEFYILRREYAVLGLSPCAEVLNEKFKGCYIDYDDARLTEVMKGYTMQAIFYHLTFEPFCPNKKCRLFNAHRQEELIEAQLGGKELCKRHRTILAKLVG